MTINYVLMDLWHTHFWIVEMARGRKWLARVHLGKCPDSVLRGVPCPFVVSSSGLTEIIDVKPESSKFQTLSFEYISTLLVKIDASFLSEKSTCPTSLVATTKADFD